MTPETEDQLRQYFRDETAAVDGRPELVRDAVRAGKTRLRRRSAAVGAAVAACLGIALVVPSIQSHTGPDQHDSSPAAPAPTPALPHIATASSRPETIHLADLRATLRLTSDGRCLVVGAGDDSLVVWPMGYSVVLRDGHVTVLDETGAEAARVGDFITAPGVGGEAPANACGLTSASNIEGGVHTTRP
jgi:hypothetical protein